MSEHSGHRQRMYEKLREGKLLEHEKLEALLFNAVPRRNTNELAHRLIARFGTIRGIFDASMEQLTSVDGIGESVASYLCLIGSFYNSYYSSGGEERPKRYERVGFKEYVRRAYAYHEEEVLDFYLLDKNGNICLKRRFTGVEGAGHSVELSPEAFTAMLVEEKPAGIVAVHNHPTGASTPSEADDATTAKCQMACSFHNVLFCDHLIYGAGSVYSYYETGKMREISKECSVEQVVR